MIQTRIFHIHDYNGSHGLRNKKGNLCGKKRETLCGSLGQSLDFGYTISQNNNFAIKPDLQSFCFYVDFSGNDCVWCKECLELTVRSLYDLVEL